MVTIYHNAPGRSIMPQIFVDYSGGFFSSGLSRRRLTLVLFRGPRTAAANACACSRALT